MGNERPIVVHIITHDKFTRRYIVFFRKYFSCFQNIFMVGGHAYTREASLWKESNFDFQDIVRYDQTEELAENRSIVNMLEAADKIIVSGIFGVEEGIYELPLPIKKKMFWHFWGGDILKFDESKMAQMKDGEYKKNKFVKCLEEIKGYIFLTPNEYGELVRIYGVEKEYYVASMPIDPDYYREDYTTYVIPKIDSTMRIIVGNSATVDNMHEGVFDELSRFKEEDLLIYCPLVYGEEKYKERVLNKGKEIFGEKFIPVTEWTNLEQYNYFLGKMDIGVFAMTRQQAMGNIWALLMMGKKVFLNDEGKNYIHFTRDYGFYCYGLSELKEGDYKSFATIDLKKMSENIRAGHKDKIMEKIVLEWKNVFFEELV